MTCRTPDYETDLADTLDPLSVTLNDVDGAMDLSSATSVVLVLRAWRTGERSEWAMDIDAPASAGVVSRDWGDGAPAAGDYDAKYHVTIGGDVAVVPTSGKLLYRFVASL
jgi:hypothetical protein